MSEWHHSKNRHNSDFRKLLQERLGKNNPRRKLTAALSVVRVFGTNGGLN